MKAHRVDPVDALTRSGIMRAVKNRRVKSTELALRARLVSAGVRGWQMYGEDLPGTPDFVFQPEKLAIFVHGCFWHGCPHCYRRPRSNRKYWDQKIKRNRSRDACVTAKLQRTGWSVLRLWEHSLDIGPHVVAKILKARQRCRQTRGYRK